HSEKEAQEAEDNFTRIFSRRELPENASELDLTAYSTDGSVDITEILTSLNIVESKSEVKRLIQQGAIKINNERVEDFRKPLKVKNGDILRVGKKQFFKIIVTK
ncbi:MAG: S4 domain-containing protein, partial [Caldisericaceae bacterium]